MTYEGATTMREINRRSKEEYAEIVAAMGRHPSSRDKEYWDHSERYKEAVIALHTPTGPTLTSETAKVEKIQTETGEEREVIVDSERLCEFCWEPLKKKPGRGRWPKRHPECKGK